MATIAQLITAFENRNWEIDKVSTDFFERVNFEFLTYELCLDGKNVFYLELTEVDENGRIVDGNIFKYGKDGDVCETWSIAGYQTLNDILNLIFAFNIQP